MPDRRDPPPTEEGWYALHDFRRIDWDAWREAPERERQRAVEEGVDHFDAHLALEDAVEQGSTSPGSHARQDADEGASALYSILGHKADFLVVHLRPTTDAIGAIERRFENTDMNRCI